MITMITLGAINRAPTNTPNDATINGDFANLKNRLYDNYLDFANFFVQNRGNCQEIINSILITEKRKIILIFLIEFDG